MDGRGHGRMGVVQVGLVKMRENGVITEVPLLSAENQV